MRFWWKKKPAEPNAAPIDWRERILQAGFAILSPHSNVAPGSFGYQVLRLEFDGLLASEVVKTGPLPGERYTRYTLTEKGRASALMMAD